MKQIKEYSMLTLKFLGFLIGGSIIISILYYFLFSSKIVNVLSILYLLFVFFFFGLKVGKKTESKGFIAGLKIGILLLLCLLLINIIFYRSSFSFIRILFYVLYLLASVFGATIGINTKKEE